MQFRRTLLLILLTTTASAAPPSSAPATEPSAKRFGQPPSATERPAPFVNAAFTLRPDETIVFAGQTNMVRAQEAGYLESQLAAAFATQRPRFRTMAWEGDTVYAQWRDLNFGGWRDQLAWAGATVVIAQYGQMEALDGAGKIDAFITAYAKLLDELSATTPRLVLMSPTPFEKPAAPLVPDHTAQNDDVRLYTRAIEKLAHDRGLPFIDVLTPLLTRGEPRLTTNGIHLTPEGHRVVAELVATQLGATPLPPARLEPVRQAVVEKNRLWFDNWRPMNWAFAYGDRQHVPFGHEAPGHPLLRIEFEEFKPLIAEADRKIHEAASPSK